MVCNPLYSSSLEKGDVEEERGVLEENCTAREYNNLLLISADEIIV